MAEYIDRQAVLDELRRLPHEYANKEQRARTGGIAACQVVVRNIPPADVRPVVLCDKCRWFTDTGYPETDPDMPELRMGHCRILGRDVQACWFCGTGEWRERVLFRCPNCGSYNGGDAE